MYAKQGQQVRRSFYSLNRFRPVPFRNIETRPAIVSNVLKHASLSNIGDIGSRHSGLDVALALLIAPLPQSDELFRIRIRQGPEKHCRYKAKNRSIRAD